MVLTPTTSDEAHAEKANIHHRLAVGTGKEAFFEGKQLAQFGEVTKNAISSGLDNINCRVSVQIPAFYQEAGLDKTIAQFANQSTEVPFEVLILVNGPEGTDIIASRAYQDAILLQKKYPQLDIQVSHVTIPERHKGKIGLLRKLLGGWALQRAGNETRQTSLAKTVFVTQDADLQKLDPTYIANMAKIFDERTKMHGLGGFVEYSDISYSDHLFLVIKRITDAIEIMQRFTQGNISIRSGNAAFRASTYLQVKGHQPARKGE